MKAYQITYRVIDPAGQHKHTTIVRNCMSEFHAKTRMHDYAARKYPRMIAFYVDDIRQYVATTQNPFEHIFGGFK